MATGQVLYQRFYFSKSFVKHNYEVTSVLIILRYWMVCAELLLVELYPSAAEWNMMPNGPRCDL